MGKKFSQSKLAQIIELYLTGEYNCHSLAKKLDISPMGVWRVLKRHNIPINNDLSEIYRIYNIDHNYFDSIDSERKAYWFGLLMADGCIKDDRDVLSIGLKEEDKYLLEMLRDDLKSNKPLYFRDLRSKNPTWSNSYTIDFNSKILVSRLIELGCVPRKSLSLEFPKEQDLPRYLLKHFIRGYIDGDGCICLSKTRPIISVNLVSTEMFCNSLALYIKEELNIHCSYTAKVRKDIQTTSRILSISGNLQVLKFLDWLYENASIFMLRKYNKYVLGKNILLNRKIKCQHPHGNV